MKNKEVQSLFQLLLFLFYASSIFFIKNYFLLIALGINIGFMAWNKISFKEGIQNLISIFPFVLLTVLLNFIFMNWLQAILIGFRILLVCNITYSYSHINSVSQIASAIELVMKPLKKVGIRTEGIGLIINIAISFLPILKNELNQLILSLKAKGLKINVRNMTFVMERVIIAIFKRTDQIEEALIVKGYQEE